MVLANTQCNKSILFFRFFKVAKWCRRWCWWKLDCNISVFLCCGPYVILEKLMNELFASFFVTTSFWCTNWQSKKNFEIFFDIFSQFCLSNFCLKILARKDVIFTCICSSMSSELFKNASRCVLDLSKVAIFFNQFTLNVN